MRRPLASNKGVIIAERAGEAALHLSFCHRVEEKCASLGDTIRQAKRIAVGRQGLKLRGHAILRVSIFHGPSLKIGYIAGQRERQGSDQGRGEEDDRRHRDPSN